MGDFGSQGRVHRILGTDGRIHHYMSDLERDYYFHLLWQDNNFIDIKEQYPLLPLARTQELADNCGFMHPCDPVTKCPIVMTTDFVITVREKDVNRTIARAVKHATDIQKERTRQKNCLSDDAVTDKSV